MNETVIKKELLKEIGKFNEFINNYNEALKELYFSIGDDEELKSIEKIQEKLFDLEFESKLLRRTIDRWMFNYTWEKIEEEEYEIQV